MVSAKSQDLTSHQWTDRVILLYFDDIENPNYKNQISEFHKHKSGLKDRKLIVYLVKPNEYKKGLSSTNWRKIDSKISNYKKTNSEFEFVLIGLDGGIKHQQLDFISCEKLFSIIDVMPMRRNELKNRD